jgi:hypothetical protein
MVLNGGLLYTAMFVGACVVKLALHDTTYPWHDLRNLANLSNAKIHKAMAPQGVPNASRDENLRKLRPARARALTPSVSPCATRMMFRPACSLSTSAMTESARSETLRRISIEYTRGSYLTTLSAPSIVWVSSMVSRDQVIWGVRASQAQ